MEWNVIILYVFAALAPAARSALGYFIKALSDGVVESWEWLEVFKTFLQTFLYGSLIFLIPQSWGIDVSILTAWISGLGIQVLSGLLKNVLKESKK